MKLSVTCRALCRGWWCSSRWKAPCWLRFWSRTVSLRRCGRGSVRLPGSAGSASGSARRFVGTRGSCRGSVRSGVFAKERGTKKRSPTERWEEKLWRAAAAAAARSVDDTPDLRNAERLPSKHPLTWLVKVTDYCRPAGSELKWSGKIEIWSKRDLILLHFSLRRLLICAQSRSYSTLTTRSHRRRAFSNHGSRGDWQLGRPIRRQGALSRSKFKVYQSICIKWKKNRKMNRNQKKSCLKKPKSLKK